MWVIGVTGGIACGKSLAAAYWSEMGVAVCEADTLAHEVMEPGGEAYPYVVDAFGRDILRADGAIDRKKLGKKVFASESERRVLNACVHPFVERAWKAWMRRQRERRTPMAVVVVPLLFEAYPKGWDAVVCVAAPAEWQMEKLKERGLTATEARQRIAAQWPLPDKIRKSDYVIFNAGSREALRQQVKRVTERILENAHG